MKENVNMPKFGMTMKEGVITKWLKAEGDFVNKGDDIAEVETEKITNSVESPISGVLEKIMYAEGETVAIAETIAVIETEAEDNQDIKETSNQEKEVPNEGEKTIAETKAYAGLRKTIGDRMSESLKRSPQGTMTTRADMTEIIKMKKEYASKGYKVSMTDIFAKIICSALEKNPILNASVQDEEIIMYKSINLGVALGTEEGLYVPVIKNVQEKSILQISDELKVLAAKIKENQIEKEDITGGTFTMSNMGMFDVDMITPIINPPEAAILSIGTTRKEVVVEDDDTTNIRPMTTLSLTADHAAMDGIPAVQFLKDIKEIMKQCNQFLDV